MLQLLLALQALLAWSYFSGLIEIKLGEKEGCKPIVMVMLGINLAVMGRIFGHGARSAPYRA